MKLTIFEGNKGDCLLLRSSDGKNILVDGGLVKEHFGKIDSYSDNVAPTLSRLRESGGKLDLVCVSHIDQDHIGGVLRMLNDEFAWRVFTHQSDQGLPVDPPINPRPPAIEGIWHNAFHDQVGMNKVKISDAVAAAAPLSTARGLSRRSHGDDFLQDLATSMKEAAHLSRRIDARQLKIQLNAEFGGKLVMRRRSSQPIEIGNFNVTVIGPTGKRLSKLREKWDAWLQSVKGARQIRRVREQADREEELLRTAPLEFLLAQSELGPAIGERTSVTEENIASIVLLVEEDNKTVLLTGDARDDHIVEDLIESGKADSEGHLHLDVLKVQHHGSENNFSEGFAKKVTADHYIFCGNGKHENPDLRVVQRLIDSRIGPASARSPNPQVGDPFKIWFTSDGTTFKADREHMKKVSDLLGEREAESAGQMSHHLSNERSFTLSI